MTLLTSDPPATDATSPFEPADAEAQSERDRRSVSDAEAPMAPLSPRTIGWSVFGWSVVLVLAVLSAAYPLGPLFQRRDQHQLLDAFRSEVQRAADAEAGLAGLLAAESPEAPALGDPVAIVDLGRLRLQQVVVEGVDPAQTRRGPGHVPGTAGLGQPGNAVVVGRRSTAGGPFTELSKLRDGDEIVATTTQGQSAYVVRSTRVQRPDVETYGPSEDDRLTLVTSASRSPLARGEAIVVVAELQGRPFEPTAQGSRSSAAEGRRGSDDAWPSIALFGLAYASTAVIAGILYRRWRPVTAYLLTTPALVVFAVLAAEAILELLPAWA